VVQEDEINDESDHDDEVNTADREDDVSRCLHDCLGDALSEAKPTMQS